MRMHVMLYAVGAVSLLNIKGENANAQGAPVPYAYVREADVMWSKKIWRVIDLREKMNLPLYYPADEMADRKSLFDVITRGISSGELVAFSPIPAAFTSGEEFKTKLTPADAAKLFTREETITVQDTGTGELSQKTVTDTIRSAEIVQYRIEEEWFFDKQRSVFEVRILGIAPVVETTDDFGEFKGYKTLCWLYFPDCRNYFSQYKGYNPSNDAEWRTFDEIFQKRIFSSYISQESNVFNRPIAAYAQGIDALLEAEEIKERIAKFEEDLWHY